MRVCHIVNESDLVRASGVGTFIRQINTELPNLGVDSCIVSTGGALQRLEVSDKRTVFHIHGLWLGVQHRAASLARRCGIPIVWSTHGMTAPWSLHHKWWKKCIPWHLYQLSDLRSAALIHCTTDLEAEWNKALGFKNAFIAPLGTMLPSEVKARGEGEHGKIRTLLYVGRIYPVKALDNAIRAIALMKNSINLRIVGPDQAGHMAELMSLCDQLGLAYTKPCEAKSTVHLLSPPAFSNSPEIQFVGPRYDSDLSAEYDNCDGLILVSHTENFGATVVDAMAHGKSVITSTNTPWKIVADKGCGWWVDNDPESLAKAFDGFASASTSDLSLLGQNGRALVEERYTWHAVGKTLKEVYEKVVK